MKLGGFEAPSEHELISDLKMHLVWVLTQVTAKEHSATFWNRFLIGVELVLTATMGSFCYGEFSHPSSFFNLPIVATLAAGNIVVMTIHASGKFESKADLLKKYKSVGNNLVAECEVQIATFARDALQTEASLKLKAAYVQYVDSVSPFLDALAQSASSPGIEMRPAV
mmetsp:Transcript_76843/g.220695  ORF Transcript_76843/g.220695 Transcript_76843/m.220695 type:complete len:168 (+) Transcript_76843:365-868(+)|eukprot:CAMPEP_0119486900 /NCGR_PEP_ID=MMETSP1344-20130328/13152_1 /TAXON_ID=236787 /ORGANISM="Florenciella parvula, Strain CCMP2471" /LENGTH=167 /DNA_ID=CAMNT_0007521705 /DNA_START=242 /DNA_END=745 /DNA_ORIENTATION=+